MQALVRDPAGQLDLVLEPVLLDPLSEGVLVGPAADEHQTDAGLHVPHRLDDERLPFETFETAREHDGVAVRSGFERNESLDDRRRVVQDVARQPERAPQTILHVLRVREDALGLAERDPVALLHHVTHLGPLDLLAEIGELRVVPQFVRTPVLMDQPDHLAFVRDEVCGELERDDHVDRQAVGLGQVERAPHGHLVHDLGRRVPLAGDHDLLGVVPRLPQGANHRLGVRLGPPAHERRLGVDDRDPHWRPRAWPAAPPLRSRARPPDRRARR